MTASASAAACRTCGRTERSAARSSSTKRSSWQSAHRPRQHRKDVYFLGLFQRLADGVLGVFGGTLDQQKGGLALAGGVAAVAQRLLPAGGVGVGRFDRFGARAIANRDRSVWGLWLACRGLRRDRVPRKRGNHTGRRRRRQPSINRIP